MNGKYHRLVDSNMKHLYYTVQQCIAHHTMSGCPLSSGDILGTGTISAPGLFGSMHERGTQYHFDLQNGETRNYLSDGDTVRLNGHCEGDGFKIGFGSCEGMI